MVVALRKTVDTEAELSAMASNQHAPCFSDIRCARGAAGRAPVCAHWHAGPQAAAGSRRRACTAARLGVAAPGTPHP
jgi:hypothetical protein